MGGRLKDEVARDGQEEGHVGVKESVDDDRG